MKQMLIFLIASSLLIRCNAPSKTVEELNDLKLNSQIDSDTLWIQLTSRYKSINVEEIRMVDSLYNPGYSSSIPPYLVKKFIPLVPPNEAGYVYAAFKVELPNNLLALISVWQSDTLTFTMDIFDGNRQKILATPINKFYGISLTSYAYRTEVILKNDSLYLNREIRRITDPEYYKFIAKDIYLGQYCLRKSIFDLKTKKEYVTFEDCRNTKLKQVMNISLGLVEAN